MARFTPRDVREILQLLEDGINLMPRRDKLEKMRMRSKIRRQAIWLSGLTNPTPEMVFRGLGERLSDLFSSYPYGFSDRVKKLLEEKTHLRAV